MPLPMSASAALKMLSSRKHFGGNPVPVQNRYTALAREASPAPDSGGRPRSDSVKWKEPEGSTFAEIAGKNNTGTPEICVEDNETVINDLTLDVVKVRSLLDKAGVEINDHIKDPGTVTVLSTMCEAMREICAVQDKLATNQLSIRKRCNTGNSGKLAVNMVSLGAINKKPRQDISLQNFVPQSQSRTNLFGSGAGTNFGAKTGHRAGQGKVTQNGGTDSTAVDAEPDPVKRQFREAVKEAEKVLCYLI
jgi:hypothetical protein